MWAGGHAESCGAGVILPDWVNDDMVRELENDIIEAYRQRNGKSSLDFVRNDEAIRRGEQLTPMS
jgi:hypothetical protein